MRFRKRQADRAGQRVKAVLTFINVHPAGKCGSERGENPCAQSTAEITMTITRQTRWTLARCSRHHWIGSVNDRD